MKLPDFLIKLVALFMPIARLILHDLGIEREMSAGKAERILGWKWEYNSEQAILAAAGS
jgi:dihydroflavonol-4-reductase